MACSLSSNPAAGEPDLTTRHRTTKLFLKIVRAYHIRQYIFPHLTATEAARLIYATWIGPLIGQQERSRVLNPMRNLFTDDELDDIKSQLENEPNHHVLAVGRDLENLYARVENPEKLDSGIPLQISIVEATAHGLHPYHSNVATTITNNATIVTANGTQVVNNTYSTAVGGVVVHRVGHVGRAESTTKLPGKWSMAPQDSRVGIFNTGRQQCEVSEEKSDIRDKRIRLRRRRVQYVVDRRGGQNRFENLTNKGLMTLLKGNVQQTLGKTNRLTTVAGPDSNGLLATVLDKMVFMDFRDPVLKEAINSGKTRRDAVLGMHVQGYHIAVPLEHEKDSWYIPMGPVTVLKPVQ